MSQLSGKHPSGAEAHQVVASYGTSELVPSPIRVLRHE
jgi:hypothetical protein